LRSQGSAARVQRTAAIRPSSMLRAHPSSESVSIVPVSPGPTVFTSAFSDPKRAPISANAASTARESVTSTEMPIASGLPRSRSAATASSSWSWRRASTATRAPSSAIHSAAARPIPLEPPVTTADAPRQPRSMRGPPYD
jgi:hypothetical protein